MRIVQIVPGSGGHFYCENCLRDVALVKALRAMGHDVILVPMYLPVLGEDRQTQGCAPLFYGALSLYLKQQFPSLRRAPAWLDRMLDAPQLLRWIARNAKSTRAASLEAMTLSMLRGEEGNQAPELGRLVDWLREEARPDVVHLSNALLLGLAHRIRAELRVPLVCSLQDEDSWVEAMSPEGRQAVWDTMAEKAEAVDAFVAVSRYYAGEMRARLRIPGGKLHVVYIGIDLTGVEPAAGPVRPPAVGYLSRMSRSLGLDMVVDAFIRLKEDGRLRDLRLKIMGGHTADDHEFVGYLRRRMDDRAVLGDVEFAHGFETVQRREFLRSISVLTVPVPGGLAFGMCQLEAMAFGVPVVQPREGAFPELVETTGGGIVYHPNDVDQLADSLASLLLDHDQARELGRRGRAAVLERFSVQRMAAETMKVYEAVKGGQ